MLESRRFMAVENESWISQIRKGVMELAILALLSNKEMYGFEIISNLRKQPELAISSGTIYPLLSRLKKASLIDSIWRESPVGPPRKYYRLTQKGHTELNNMSHAWFSVSNNLNELLKGGRPLDDTQR